MEYSWPEIRTRAASFAAEWADARYERSETQSFYNEFFEVFGVRRRQVATFEEPVKKLGERQGFIDLFWKGVLLVEQKSAGRSLVRAKEQALDYFPGLKPYELPRYILLSDFQTFELHDLETTEPALCFNLADLPNHVDQFGFVIGVERRTFRDQDPANIIASELMAKLHDSLKNSGYRGHDLERYLVRLLFCLFADGTGIFNRGSFNYLISERTNPNGSDLGGRLAELFQTLDCPEDERQEALDDDFKAFPYVNGELFAERLPIAHFTSKMRDDLLAACGFAWQTISPAIFGSLFQAVMKPAERRAQGAHYTTERNILKVIEPLFLNGLRAEFERLRARTDTRRRGELEAFHDRLVSLRFFDPACGCGNFLVITYRELREIETALLVELRAYRADELTAELDVSTLSKLNVDQFYGIELEEFPARIAEVAMWMTDHIANNELSLAFGRVYARIPLRTAPHIVPGDSLEVDWRDLLPPSHSVYVLGNPPFRGAKYQTELQRRQVRRIAALGGTGGTLDFVAAWFLKAAAYSAETPRGVRGIGFVATNSITQGEQVAQLWPALFDRFQLEIGFAHRTFAWGSDARGVAHVHVVIVGMYPKGTEPDQKSLFTYDRAAGDPTESRHSQLSPYLFDASRLTNPHTVVKAMRRRPEGLMPLIIGSKPVDGGYFIIEAGERNCPLAVEAGQAGILFPYFGSEEMLNGGERWIITPWILEPEALRRLPLVMQAIENVRRYRLGELPPRDDPEGENKKPSAGSIALADTPKLFHVTVVPNSAFLCVPKVSSETRRYIPCDMRLPPAIPSDLVYIVRDAPLWLLAILNSAMHTAWATYIGGRLESRYRYSASLCYNPFPWPVLSDAIKTSLTEFMQRVLAARRTHSNSTLSDLYHPVAMPDDLRRAHRDLDTAVDRLYRPAPFASDRERVENLLHLYEISEIGLVTAMAPAKKSRKAKAI